MNNRNYIEIALLTAGAIVLTMLTIPVPGLSFLRIDLSIVLIYLVFTRNNPKAGYFSLFVTMMFNVFINGPVAFGIGQLAYILAFIIFYYTYTGLHKISKKTIFNSIVTLMVMIITMTTFNYFILTPAYILTYGGFLEDGSFFTVNTYFTIGYFLTIISIYPFFNLIQWGINIWLITVIRKIKKSSN